MGSVPLDESRLASAVGGAHEIAGGEVSAAPDRDACELGVQGIDGGVSAGRDGSGAILGVGDELVEDQRRAGDVDGLEREVNFLVLSETDLSAEGLGNLLVTEEIGDEEVGLAASALGAEVDEVIYFGELSSERGGRGGDLLILPPGLGGLVDVADGRGGRGVVLDEEWDRHEEGAAVGVGAGGRDAGAVNRAVAL